ncbi:MAG: hypothetical protein HC840_08595 [Leptolyngbyaceae cyanobacterium RM2_2_4]|nr:hypothetical protein [Leptolyngbyaceae cyanobacterium SM1_4_3]NJN92177.1 hypothetical protein [Leptolyngbyaceae cyanobacterium SL_5_14]NJO49484.1 hypothetical protein [Leptolyngbyaceae cyanobacterium RM2_2_4]
MALTTLLLLSADLPLQRQLKTLPLLSYYVRSADPTRQAYGMAGIRSLGAPYSTLWLERQLEQRQSGTNFYLLTQNPVSLLNQTGYDPAQRGTSAGGDRLLPQPSPRYTGLHSGRASGSRQSG